MIYVLKRGERYVANVKPPAWTSNVELAQHFGSADEAAAARGPSVRPVTIERIR